MSDEDEDFPDVIQNAVKYWEADGTERYLVSSHTHDFRTYSWEDGSSISVDGGLDYIRRSHKMEVKHFSNYYEEFNLTNQSSIEECKEKMLWAYIPVGEKQDVIWSRLADYSSRQLVGILDTQFKISEDVKKTIEAILEDRT
jgi:hypothetical protein